MLKRLQETNLRAEGVENHFLTRASAMADPNESGPITLETIMDKKRILREKKTLASGKAVTASSLDLAMGERHQLSVTLDKAKILGDYRVCSNEFTNLPKGALTVQVAALT